MIVVYDRDKAFRARAAEDLARRDVAEAAGPADLERILAENAGAVSVVLAGPNGDGLRTAERIEALAPAVSVVAVVGALTSEVLQAALRAGVRDVLPESFKPTQLRDAVRRAEGLARQAMGRSGSVIDLTEEAPKGRAITVFSPKGGVGKSFLSANLAILLAQREGPEAIALADFDLEFGDLAIMLQVFPPRTIYDAAVNADHLDPDALKGYMSVHACGASLLAAPLEPGLAETISTDTARAIVGMLKERFRSVVIDTPHSFTDHALAALDESEEFVLMATLDIPCIKNLKLSLRTLEMLGLARERIRIVLNRADSKVGLRVQEVEKTLGTSVDVCIPSSRDVPLSINRGTPLVLAEPKSPVTVALGKLADALAAAAPAPSKAAEPRQGRFGFARRGR